MKTPFSSVEDDNLLNYVAQRANEATAPLNLTALWRDYREHSGSERTVGTLHERYRGVLSQKLYSLEQFDFATKVRMLFATFVPLNEGNAKMLREQAEILEVSERNVLLRYKKGDLEVSAYGEDGKLASNLKGGEARSKHRKRKWEEPEHTETSSIPEPEPIDTNDPNLIQNIILQLLRAQEQQNQNAPTAPTPPESIPDAPGPAPDYFIGETSSALTPPAHEEQRKSVRDFMTYLQNMVIFLNSSALEDVQRRIHEAMNKLQEADQLVSLSRLRIALESMFGLAFSCADGSNDVTSSLLAFLHLFKTLTMSIESSDVVELQEKVDGVVEKIGGRNVQIPTTNIRLAVENAFLLIYNEE